MNTLSYKTKSASKETVVRDWYVVDAQNVVLGRMASKIASVLRGKHKPSYTPHVDCGDYVIVINADKVRLTGKKWDQKIYDRYSGYPGGRTETVAKDQLARKPESIVEMAVKGMLPKSRLANQMFNKLYVYSGSEHPHQAQKPQTLNID